MFEGVSTDSYRVGRVALQINNNQLKGSNMSRPTRTSRDSSDKPKIRGR